MRLLTLAPSSLISGEFTRALQVLIESLPIFTIDKKITGIFWNIQIKCLGNEIFDSFFLHTDCFLTLSRLFDTFN